MNPPPRTIGVRVSAGEAAVVPDGVAERDAAFTRLMAAEQARISRLASRLLGWSTDVDDVVQEVFVQAWTAMPKFRGDAQVETWLTRIAINACRAHRRRRATWWNWWKGETDGAGTAAMTVEASQRASDAETLGDVRDAVRSLSPRDREVIVLRYLEDLPPADICGLLDVSRNVLDVRLSRARARLQTLLAGRLEDEA